MPLVWVTGNSGTGKSTICDHLRRRGLSALDADDVCCRWVDRASGEAVIDPPDPVPQGWLDSYGWAIVRESVERIAEASSDRTTFVCGSAENESTVLDLFDLVLCLVADDATIRHRLLTRTDNDFGKHPEELAATLMWNPRMRRRYERIGAVIVDATQSPEQVTDQVVAAAERLNRLGRA